MGNENQIELNRFGKKGRRIETPGTQVRWGNRKSVKTRQECPTHPHFHAVLSPLRPSAPPSSRSPPAHLTTRPGCALHVWLFYVILGGLVAFQPAAPHARVILQTEIREV